MLNDLIDYLGEPTMVSGGHHYWQCPYCMDSGKDNLIYTESKNIVKCMSCDDGAANVLKEINKKKKERGEPVNKPTNKPKNKKEFDKEKGFLYWGQCMDELQADTKALAYLEKARGINKQTVIDCGIGFDRKDKKWVLPVIGFDGELKGLEYRPPDFTVFKYPPEKPPKCRKESGTPAILSQINMYSEKTEVLIIIEGFLDGYLYWQFLQEKKVEGYHIVTPSMGVGSTLRSINQEKENLSRYKQVFVFLDNDPPKWCEKKQKMVSPGQDMTQEILEIYKEFKPMKLKCGCKDFGDHYTNCKEKRK